MRWIAGILLYFIFCYMCMLWVYLILFYFVGLVCWLVGPKGRCSFMSRFLFTGRRSPRERYHSNLTRGNCICRAGAEVLRAVHLVFRCGLGVQPFAPPPLASRFVDDQCLSLVFKS